jgi:hypothetical protein
MCQIGKRQWNENENTLIIPGVKHDRTIKHLIPQILRPLFSDYRLKEHKAVAMSQIFHRIIEKSELQLEAGYGWNSFRRTITTMAEKLFLPKNDIPASLWSDYTGWAKRTAGEKFFNSAMAGYYSHTEILDQDPYWIDKQIYAVHPFLKTWSTVLSLPRLTDTITQDDETITEEDYTKLPADDTPAVELSPLEKLLQDLKNEKPYEKT